MDDRRESGVEESGQRLATFIRPGFGGRAPVQLRLVLDEVEGKAFVSLRQWELTHGGYVPTKRGTSIRLSEVHQLIEALRGVAEWLGIPEPPPGPAGEPRRDRVEQRRAAGPTPIPEGARDQGGPAEDFDEFAENRKHPARGRGRG